MNTPQIPSVLLFQFYVCYANKGLGIECKLWSQCIFNVKEINNDFQVLHYFIEAKIYIP